MGKEKTFTDADAPLQAWELVRDIGKGSLNDEMSDRINQVTQRLLFETIRTQKAKKGEVIIKLKFDTELNGEDEVLVRTAYEVDRKEPAPVRRHDMFFIDGQGTLRREAPSRSNDGPLFNDNDRNKLS